MSDSSSTTRPALTSELPLLLLDIWNLCGAQLKVNKYPACEDFGKHITLWQTLTAQNGRIFSAERKRLKLEAENSRRDLLWTESLSKQNHAGSFVFYLSCPEMRKSCKHVKEVFFFFSFFFLTAITWSRKQQGVTSKADLLWTERPLNKRRRKTRRLLFILFVRSREAKSFSLSLLWTGCWVWTLSDRTTSQPKADEPCVHCELCSHLYELSL